MPTAILGYHLCFGYDFFQAAHNRSRVGINVRRLRKSKGLSQREFGMMVGVDYSYISHIENGTANPSVDLLSKIAEGLDVEVSDLFL